MKQQGSHRNKLSKWWFVVRGEEEVLKQLGAKWNLVEMQLDWKLEPLLKFSEANTQPTERDVHQANESTTEVQLATVTPML